MQKDHSVAENTQMNIQLINFNILLGLSLTSICSTNDMKKINNKTNIHLDLQQTGCLRPHTITTNIVVSLDEYLLISSISGKKKIMITEEKRRKMIIL